MERVEPKASRKQLLPPFSNNDGEAGPGPLHAETLPQSRGGETRQEYIDLGID